MRASMAGALLSGSGPVRYVVDTNPDPPRDLTGSRKGGRQRRDANMTHDGQTIARAARRTSCSIRTEALNIPREEVYTPLDPETTRRLRLTCV
jgi:hypothetical protein